MANISNINGFFIVDSDGDSTFAGKIIGQDSDSVQLELKRTSSGTDGNTSIKFVQPLGNGFFGVNSSGALSFGTAANLITDNKFKVDRNGNGTFAGEVTISATTQYLNFNKPGVDILSTIVSETDAGTGGKLRFLTKRNGDTQLNALVLDDNQNAAFTGRVSIQGDRINFTNASASSIPKIFTNETETGTGLMRIQAGGISGSYGGGITLYANAHASKPGDVVAGLSGGASAAKFRVNLNGVDTGADVFTVNRSGNGIFTGSVTATSFIGTLPTGQFLPIANPTFTGTLTGPKIFAHGVANVIELKQLSAGSATYYVMDNTIETGGKNWRFGYTGCSSDKGSFSVCNTTDDVMSLFLDSSGNATVIGNITASGTSSILNTGNSGTFVTNDANDYPRISTSTANIQLGLFRTGSGSGGVYIGGFSGGFEVRNGSSLAPIFNVNQSGTVTLTGDKTINTNSSLRLNAGGGTLFLDSTTNIILRTGGTSPALTLSSSQNVTLNSATALDFQVEDFAQIKFRESGAITIDSDNDQANRNFSIKDGSGTNLLLVLDTGDVTATGDVIAFSDKKLKKNIKTLDGSKVYKMRGVSFDRIDTDKASSGVIAQEMQEIAPELVNESEGTLGVAYGNLTGYLIEAIKELEARIKILENK